MKPDLSAPDTALDFHVHATHHRRDPKMTVAGIINRASELGLVELGILEHLAPSRGRPVEVLESIRADCGEAGVPDGLAVFRGAEIDVTPAGVFEGPADVRERLGLDSVIAGIHQWPEGVSAGELLADYLRMMLTILSGSVPFDVMAHPWRGIPNAVGKLVGKEASFSLVPKSFQHELIAACREKNVAIEVSAGSPLDDPVHDEFLADAVARGVKLAFGSDAHYFDALGRTEHCARAAHRIGAHPADIWHPGR